jgi:hypothetical protein
MAIAGRLDEVLDAAVGVNRSSSNVLTVSVIEADAEYRFATGMITSRHIASGSTVFEAVPPGGPAGTDPRLRRVIEAWPQMNDAVRDRIAGLVEGAGLLRSSE